MTAHFHTAAMRLFYVPVMAPLRYLDGVPDGSSGRSVFISIYPVTHDSGSKPRGSRSHQRQQQEAQTFASSCFPDILVNVAPMNAANLFVLRMYMVDSFVASTYVPASLSCQDHENFITRKKNTRKFYNTKIS